MYHLILTNFGEAKDYRAQNLGEILAYARSIGFQCTIYWNGDIRGSWCPIGGYRPILASDAHDISTIYEYGLAQKLSNSIRCF